MFRRTHAVWLKRSIALAGSLLVCVVLAEAVSRQLLKDEFDFNARSVRRQMGAIRELVAPSSVEGLYYELRRGLDMTWRRTRVVTDPLEPRRIDPNPCNSDVSGTRIALIGDSNAFGWGVEYAQTYGELLRQKLAKRSGKAVTVHNWATPGYNSRRNRITYRDRVRQWKPALLIVHYDHNDADPAPTFDDAGRAGLQPTFALEVLLRRSADRIAAIWSIAPAGDLETVDQFLHGYRYAGPRYRRHLDEMRELAHLAQRDGTPAVVLIYNPWLRNTRYREFDPFFQKLHKPLVKRIGSMGFHVIDSYDRLQALMRRRQWADLRPLWVSKGDAHPNPEAHQLIANLLFERIEDQGLLERAATPVRDLRSQAHGGTSRAPLARSGQ